MNKYEIVNNLFNSIDVFAEKMEIMENGILVFRDCDNEIIRIFADGYWVKARIVESRNGEVFYE